MVQRCDSLGFAFKLSNAIGIGGKCFGQDLDRHFAIELRVTRTIHLAHSTRAERREDFVRTQAGANRETHLTRAAVKLTTTVIGAPMAGSSGTGIRNRSSVV